MLNLTPKRVFTYLSCMNGKFGNQNGVITSHAASIYIWFGKKASGREEGAWILGGVKEKNIV